MDTNQCSVRRATLDDLPALKGLWEVSRLPALELERHLTEFQVITRPDGVLIGAIGLRVAGHHGLLYGEAFYRPEGEDDYRPLLWDRLQVLARNHSLGRLWTREGAPFWHQAGFQRPTPEGLQKFPPAFGDPQAAWMTIQLHHERLLSGTLEKEFELFQVTQRAATERMLRRARVLKWVAGLIAVAFFAGALGLAVVILKRSRRRPAP